MIVIAETVVTEGGEIVTANVIRDQDPEIATVVSFKTDKF